jgi:hypothetical protein
MEKQPTAELISWVTIIVVRYEQLHFYYYSLLYSDNDHFVEKLFTDM